MILKALYDYYIKCVENDPNSLPPYGFDSAEIAYEIVITNEGSFQRLSQCKKIDDGNHYVLRWVPRGFDRTSDKTAQILWDKTKYVLGFENDKIKEDSVELLNFIEIIKELVVLFPKNKTFRAINLFYQKKEYNNVIKNQNNKDAIIACGDKQYISFSLVGENDIVASYMNEDVKNDLVTYIQIKENQLERGTCLVTGKHNCPIVKKTGITPLLSATSGKLVAFQKNRGYDSYGYSQGQNAPISSKAEHAIYIALKELLNKDIENQENDNRIDITLHPHKRKNKNGRMVKVGEKQRAYIFWCSEPANEIEDSIASIFVPRQSEIEIKKTLLSFKKGAYSYDENIRFFLLGLSPNGKARIAVNFWSEITLGEAVKNIMDFYKNIKIDSQYDVVHNVVSMIQATTKAKRDKKKQKLSYTFRANLSEYIVKAIIFNQQLPSTLYYDCIQRFKKEQRPIANDEDLTPYEFEKRENIRAGIVRLYLNKDNLYYNNNKIITSMLNKEDNNPGYLCGRLFALLERIQGVASESQKQSDKEKDSPKEYRTNIRARYIDAASSVPSSVFPTLIRLSSHHSDTLKSKNKFDFEPMKEEIINKFENGCFPDQLDIKEQGRFFIGYYQQRQDFYMKKEDNKNE